MPSGRKKAPAASQYGGQAKPAYFGFGEDFEIKGYWLHPTKHLSAEIAIFDHSYYPKIDATNSEIDSNITWRKITLPSLQELRSQGISIDEAIVVSEVNVPPRHIRNRNFFRTNFPAMVKQTARQYNYAIIFPANDMPSARFKRKEVLNLYRSMFSPLLINGKQYTSGRMNFFFTAPKEATQGFRKSFNLDEGMNFGRRRRGATTKITIKQQNSSDELARMVSVELEKQMLPVVAQKLDLSKSSRAYGDIQDYLSSPETAQEILTETNKGKNKAKIRKWVDSKMIPYIKGVAVQEGVHMADSVLRFTLKVIATAIIGHIFQGIKVKMPRLFKHTDMGSTGVDLNIGGLSFQHRKFTPGEKLSTAKDLVFKMLEQTYQFPRQTFEDFIDVTVYGNTVKATINRHKFIQVSDYAQHTSRLANDERGDWGNSPPILYFKDDKNYSNLANKILLKISTKATEVLNSPKAVSGGMSSIDVEMF